MRTSVPGLARLALAAALALAVSCGTGDTAPPATAAAPSATERAGAADVPYTLTLDPFAVPGLPGLHSFAYAGEPSRLVLLAGRTNGLHGFAPSREAAEFPSFPREFANDTVYVVDLPGGRLLGSAAVGGLPAPYAQQLQSSNPQWLETDGWLYLIGGYGEAPGSPEGLITLPWITVVDLEALISTVSGGGALDQAFADAHMASVEHPALAITGGEAEALDGRLLLMWGHRFDGEYAPGGGQAYQEYSNSVRVFTVAASRQGSGVALDLDFLGTVPANTQRPPDNPYHRRDLSVRPAVDPSGAPRIAAYGGVFKGGRQEGYLSPLYVTAGGGAAGPGCVAGLGIEVCEDTAAVQLLSQYDTATVPVWSASRGAMYTSFFGGISGYYWDPACSCLKRDAVDVANGIDSLPFVDSVSTLRVTAGGSEQLLHVGQSFPPAGGAPECAGSGGPVAARFLGAEGHFVTAAGVPDEDGVLDLDAIAAPTVVGYVVGGIAAWCPGDAPSCYASTQGGSCASNLIYRVTLDPGTPAETVPLTAPAEG